MYQDTKQPWIRAGYGRFAQDGPKALKVEALARHVGKSKSSFYHHFADLDVFTEALLAYHLEQARVIAAREARCQNVVPELVDVLLEVKEDLLFNRQLRVHRHVADFRRCFEEVNVLIGGAIGGIWADMLGLADNSALARTVLALSLENFYLQITEESLTRAWLLDYLRGLRGMVRSFENRKAGADVR